MSQHTSHWTVNPLILCGVFAASLWCAPRIATAGCQDEGGSGILPIGDTEALFIDRDDDGLPERYQCADESGGPLVAGDRIEGACGTFTIGLGTTGDDEVDFSEHTEPVIFFGGAGNDTITGSPWNDFLHGSRGDDMLFGGAGNDRLCLLEGPGNAQRSEGGDGDDYLFGGLDIVELYGGAGNDLLQGGVTDDIIYGGEGNDGLYGGFHNDTLFGEAGDDLLHGGEGADRFDGGEGDDAIVAVDGEGDLALMAGADADSCFIDDAAVDPSDAGDGCEVRVEVGTCPRILFAATVDGDILLIDPDNGTVGGRFDVLLDSAPVDTIEALAVSPDCELWAVVTQGADTSLVTITLDGSATSVGAVTGVLDMTFEGRGRLYALTEAGVLELDLETGLSVGSAVPVGHGGVLHYIVYDSPEGFLFLVSEGSSFDDTLFHFSNFEAHTGIDNYVAPSMTGAPTTWDSDRNHMLEVEPDGHMYDRARRYAERTDLMLVVRDDGDAVMGITELAMPHFDHPFDWSTLDVGGDDVGASDMGIGDVGGDDMGSADLGGVIDAGDGLLGDLGGGPPPDLGASDGGMVSQTTDDDDDGCGCGVTSQPRSAGLVLMVLGLGVLGCLRRRCRLRSFEDSWRSRA